MTLHVELVVPDREIWSGSARMVVAKTLDGDLGVLPSHPPVLGILAETSVVRILDPETAGDAAGAPAGGELIAETSRHEPVACVDIDVEQVACAQALYPCYVKEL